MIKFRLFLFLIIILHISTDILNSQNSESQIRVEFNGFGIVEISSKNDVHKANVVKRGSVFGMAAVEYKIGEEGDWLGIYTGETKFKKDQKKYVYTDYIEGMPIKMARTFTVDETGIDWDITVENKSKYSIEIGNFAIPLPWNKPVGENPEYVFEQGFVEHQHIAENGSFIYFTKPSGEPPFLVLMTKPQTKFEYFKTSNNTYKAYVHSKLEATRDQEGTWRLENTGATLNPEGESNDQVTYSFRMEWANSYDHLRDILYNNNILDTRIVPGMTLPQGLKAKIALRSKNRIDSIVAEFPLETEIIQLKSDKKDTNIFEVSFSKLGENMISVYYNKTEKTVLEFFSTLPIKDLINERSRFLVDKQQHKDTTKWYNGLYSVWDMKNEVLRGPDNTDGFDHWWGYVLASDDPALCKAPFLAAKNVFFPNDKEIESIEYYLKNFVWGGLQRTDKEFPNPYGIYGTPNWYVCRDDKLRAGVGSRNLDKMHIWRSYDYPHIFMLYYHMYQIAKFYPERVSYLDADGYLERAFQTAKGYFNYTYDILPWYETYKWGCYNELVLIPLIDTLEEHGRQNDADYLRSEWEKKVKYFVYDDKYPFRSEYSFDRTAFESSYAFAKYGATTKMKSDTNLWYDKKLEKWYSHPKVSTTDSREFMERQLMAGLAVRGWINNSYYFLGSDDTLSYMARMGGWGILDYALEFSESPWDWLQLGYASYLSSFALFNVGTEDSNFGYWFAGKENNGAMGWAFNPQKIGKIWLQGRESPRGPWNYDGEADLGNGAIFRTAATILAEDPTFGWITYGGTHEQKGNTFSITPKDGVLNKFWVVSNDIRVGMVLNRDGFDSSVPITFSKSKNEIQLEVNNKVKTAHSTVFKLLGNMNCSVYFNNEIVKPIKGQYVLPIEKSNNTLKIKIEN
ncbi:DUF5695 domain-containing protein [Aestuariibaculum sp. YM273]|uniref:DUF5695 domain-containing protein n=1 Tax=Aestuariibaculum sp. YM273 TaxID=3070659 RepID=UPI0027DDB780|nr:DUF5695 domain-containing protein [Aestuariibaculum sp. YM273]WMI65220.1 DUF5695 domain-containing protein [Aestuariibaculum sp. YM273]